MSTKKKVMDQMRATTKADDDGFRRLSGGKLKKLSDLKAGESFVAKLVRAEKSKNPKYKSDILIFEVDGEEVAVAGQTVITKTLEIVEQQSPNFGKMVKIIYDGKKEGGKGGKGYHSFSIFIKD